MDFIWGKLTNEKNQRLEFVLDAIEQCDALTVCAVDFYQIYLDGVLTAYGPARTAAGYVRPRAVSVKGVKKIAIKVASYGVINYSCDFQNPFFGAEVLRGDSVVYGTGDFNCYIDTAIKIDVPRYCSQRGFMEMFDFNNRKLIPLQTETVKAPCVIDEVEDRATYESLRFEKGDSGEFKGFERANECVMVDRYVSSFDVVKDFIHKNWSGYKYCDYVLSEEHTGFISLTGKTKRDVRLFILFEEYIDDGKWFFRRGGCNDFVSVTVPAGDFSVITFEPYALKYLKILFDCDENEIEFTPNLIALENGNAKRVPITGKTKVDKIFYAAYNTFKQNVLDIFMDCPSRERAGWLCDSYFMGKAEKFFCGDNAIEKAFIENFLIGETPEIEKGMLPKCFPAEHTNNLYVPNWALWFIVELKEYFERTGDAKTVSLSKEKVYGIVDFFKRYLNEYGLLENLESWVFVEWSVSNDKDYVRGLNFPSNMLYAYALDCVAALYDDATLKEQAEKVREKIVELSFNGKFFCDNSVRLNGNLLRCDNHISETCQYYALFTGLCPTEEFKRVMINEFGPMRNGAHPEIGRSNMFIGNYLRFFWLCSLGEYERVIKECEDYFYAMAEKTGTLWEHDGPTASCNHGFASAAAVILAKCLEGKKGV